jgi:aspartyl-tRNA(Asn)/glutamyl-tRNA(Gln) amidotransferase subunit C
MTTTTNRSLITADEVARVAKLARLRLAPEALQAAVVDMQRILHHVDMLAQLDVDAVPVSAHGVNLAPFRRPDEARPGLSIDSALANAPERLGDGFGVPKIIE